MRINTNSWNKIRYTLYSPAYDLIGKLLNKMRYKSIKRLGIENGDKVLIIGGGTGLDLNYIESNCSVVATDITPAMVEKMRKRGAKLHLNLSTQVMDAQHLSFPDEYFDKIILHLIIAVLPEPVKAIKEAERVLKRGGKMVVLDKFIKKGHKPSYIRQLLNMITNLLFSDITRSFEDIASSTALTTITDEDAEPTGNFRIILLSKS